MAEDVFHSHLYEQNSINGFSLSDTAQNVPRCQANYGRAPCFVLCVAKAGGFKSLTMTMTEKRGADLDETFPIGSMYIHVWYIMFTYIVPQKSTKCM